MQIKRLIPSGPGAVLAGEVGFGQICTERNESVAGGVPLGGIEVRVEGQPGASRGNRP